MAKTVHPLRSELLTELAHETQYATIKTQSQYRAHVSDYLDFVAKKDATMETWKERSMVYGYIDNLKKAGKAQTYIDYVIRGPVGCLFRMYGLRLPVKLPKAVRRGVEVGEDKRLTEEEIAKLIQTARVSGNHQWQNLMALTSIYGLRAGEVAIIDKTDVHPQKKTILIHTEKGGEPREHQVPPEIAPFIFKYDYPRLLGSKVFDVFSELAHAAGIDRGAGSRKKSIHAIRHGVFSTLRNLRDPDGKAVYSADDPFRFFRWAGANISESYTHIENQKLDEVIFKHHPFLKYWK